MAYARNKTCPSPCRVFEKQVSKNLELENITDKDKTMKEFMQRASFIHEPEVSLPYKFSFFQKTI